MIRRLLIALLAVAAIGAIQPTAHAAPAALGALDPSVEQAIVVTAKHWRTTHATLRAYERRDGRWVEVVGATRARVGSTGMIPEARRLQNTGKTPAGTFAITSAFGRKADPGTDLPYLKVDRNDTWPYWRGDPATYNVLQTARFNARQYGSFIERLWSKGAQYNYVAVMDYNLPKGGITTGADGVRRASSPADTRKGGGIFLHVDNGKATAGCISVPEATMVRLLRWLDSARSPVIITTVRP